MQICWLMLKCKHALINHSWIIQKRRVRSRKSCNAWKQFYYITLNKDKCLRAAFCNLKIHHKTVQKEGSLVKCFSTLKEKFCVPAWPRTSFYSSSKLKAKLKVISRYLEVVRLISWNSRKVTNLHAQSCPETSASFHNYFSYPELPWVTVAQSANPSTLWLQSKLFPY